MHGVEAQANDIARLAWPAQPIIACAELPTIRMLLPYTPITILVVYSGMVVYDYLCHARLRKGVIAGNNGRVTLTKIKEKT